MSQQSGNPGGELPPGRQRTTKACVACSIRKIKCDGNDPCAHCVRLFNSECFYTAAKKRGPPKGSPARGGHRRRSAPTDSSSTASAASTSELRNGWTPDTQQQGRGGGGGGGGGGATAAAVAQPPPPLPQQQAPHPTSVNGGAKAHQAFYADLSQPGIGGSSGPGGPSHAPDVTFMQDYSMSPSDMDFGGVASGPSGMFPPPAPLHQSPIHQSPVHLSPVSPVASMPRSMAPSTPTNDVSYAAQAGLTSEAIDDLLLVYETFIHPHWPAIYLPSLRSFRSLETQSPLVFDAILAISVANSEAAFFSHGNLLPTEKTSPRPLVEICDSLTESLRARVFASMNGRDNRSTLAMVQALMYVSLVDFGFGRTSLAYQMTGFACRMALDLGLHTYSLGLPSSASADPRDNRNSQERCRTLWSCFVLDKMLAAAVQRPPLLRLVDIDAPRPSVMERDELDLWLSGAGQTLLHPSAREPMECVKSHTLSSFSSWCDVMAILELILDQVYRPRTRRARMNGHHVDGYEDAVVYIDNELRKWRSSLPDHLQWNDDNPASHRNTGLHRLTVRGWYYCCMLLLHRPQVPFLDRSDSPDPSDPDASYLRRRQSQPEMHSLRLPNGAEAAGHAATAICDIMENYKQTFKVRKFASSWVYLVFQAATVHAGLAAHGPGPTPTVPESSTRAESRRRLEQCIGWLDEIAMQWSNASRHVEILRTLSSVCSTTRPPSPSPAHNDYLDIATFDQSALGDMSTLDLDAWMLLWASMPTAGDDVSLWQQCFPTVPVPR